MKKAIVLAMMICLASASAFASLGIRGIYFSPSDENFKSIYGAGWMYGGELSFRITKGVFLWLGGSYYSKTGSLTYTLEETKLTLIPVGGGLKFELLGEKIISPYFAAGVNYFLYKESNVIGDVNKGGVGFIGKAGLCLNLAKEFAVDFYGGYSSCKFTPADFEINVGGLEAGAGLVLRF